MRRLISAWSMVLLVLACLAFLNHRPVSQAQDTNPSRTAPKTPDKIELIPPQGVVLYGGADLESRMDRQGVIFVAATGKTPRGFGAVLWMQKPREEGGWDVTPIHLDGLYPGGRGSLSVEEGQLYLTLWGEKERPYRLRIKEWTR